MALVDVVGGLWMPPPEYLNQSALAYASILLDAAADRVAVVFWAPKTGNIRKIGFLTGTVPALNAASTLVMALQDVSLTTGDPDGTDDQTATIANVNIVANTMILSGNLSADRAVTRGDLLAAVIRYGTFTAADQVNIKMVSAGSRGGPTWEYVTNNLTGAYAKVAGVYPILEVEYDDGSHAASPGLAFPWATLTSDTYNNTSTPDEIGLQFQVPFACRLAGCWASMASDSDVNFNLYTASTKTLLKAIDKDTIAATGTFTHSGLFFPTPVVLAANTTYVLAAEPSSASNIVLSSITVRAAVALDQMPGGQAWQYATAKNPATTADFTATTTKRPVMGLMFDQVHDGAGGGSAARRKIGV